MRNKLTFTLMCLIPLMVSFKTLAQTAEIKVISKIDSGGGKILIRWVPTSPALWKQSNQQNTGYKLEKIRIAKNGVVLATPEKVGNDVTVKIPAFETNTTPVRKNWFQKFITPAYADTAWAVFNSESIKNTPDDLILKKDELSNNYAVAWQAVYGESVDIAGLKSEGIIDETDELQKRYNMALATAENYFEIAKFVGLGYEDSDVIPGEKYLYRVSAISPDYNNVRGTTYIGRDDIENKTKIPPYEFSVAFVDSVARINWNFSQLKKFYSSYDVYRSTDNIEFKKINSTPMVNLNDSGETSLNISDTLCTYGENKSQIFNLNQNFYYKIRGNTPFGEKGPWSETINGKIRRILRIYPIITDVTMRNEIDKDTTMMFASVSWKFDSTAVDLINGFKISYSDSSSGIYQTLPTVIPVNPLNGIASYKKEVTEVQVKKATYFKVIAIAKEGEYKESFPSVIEPLDSIPPLAPKMVSVSEISRINNGTDTLIIVRVNWQIENPNLKENKDIVGYRVYRSQFRKEEATQITNLNDIVDFFYQDTIYYSTQSKYDSVDAAGNRVASGSATNSTYSINKSVFYQVIAIDKNYNQSKLSSKIEFRRPDKVPLPPSVFSKYEVSEDGILLNWAGYADTTMFGDFKEIQILRANVPRHILSNKELLRTLKPNDLKLIWFQVAVISDAIDTTYIDVDVEPDSVYAYFMITKDLSDNKSVSNIVVVQYSNTSSFENSEADITNFTILHPQGKKYIKLNWTHQSTKVAEYQLLRGVDEQNLEDWKTVDATEKEVYDDDIKTGVLYKYGIRALYTSGKKTGLKRAEILYQ